MLTLQNTKKYKPNVTINLEIMQADYNTVLKSKIAAGSTPDVFQTTAGGDIDTFAEYSADLTNEPLAAAMTDAVKINMSSYGRKSAWLSGQRKFDEPDLQQEAACRCWYYRSAENNS